MFFKKLKGIYSSLFMKLFLCFWVIIIILIGANFLSIRYFNIYMTEKIITSDNKQFNNSVARYNDYFQNLTSRLYEHSLNESLFSVINSKQDWPLEMVDVVNLLNKKIEYVDNIFIVIQNKNLVITKYGTCLIDIFFKNIRSEYKSLYYDLLEESFITRYLNADKYSLDPFFGKRYLPFVYKPTLIKKNAAYNKFYLCALIDIDELYKSINSNNEPAFYIAYNNDYIFSTSNEYRPPLHLLVPRSNFAKTESGYVLYKSFTPNSPVYIKFCPMNDIIQQVSKINTILFYILAAVLIMAIAISALFSFQFKNPIAKLVKAISSSSGTNMPSLFDISTSVSEIRLIISRLKSMYEENNHMGNELSKKNSLLKYYFSIDKLKNIHNVESNGDLSINYSNYVVVLYKILFKPGFFEKYNNDQEKVLIFCRHFLDTVIIDSFPDSITFQVENKQFISIINLHEKDRNNVIESLKYIIDLMAHDKEYFTIVLACSVLYSDTSQLSTAYEEVFQLVKYRKLTDEHQLVLKKDAANVKFFFSISQEKLISQAMFDNNKELLIDLVNKVLEENFKKNVSSYYFIKLTIEIINNFVKVLNVLKKDSIEIMNIEEMYEQLENFYIIDNFKDLLHQSIDIFSRYISENKSDNDYINKFVLDYINNNYNTDISLDILSEKLNLSPNYLSSYFKINNGVNFLDYLHTLRINKAMELLKVASNKIQDIASKTGYNSIHSFIRTFKHYTGKTPSQYRSEACI